jgi:hypothetical protein
MDPSIPDSFHAAASRLVVELEGRRSAEVVVRCLLRAYDRVSRAGALTGDEAVLHAEEMARGLLTLGGLEQRLAS